MAHYLLVHGAWGGAWYWRDTLATLIRAGHRAHAVTLTGVGERAHLLNPHIDLDTHIADVLGALDTEEMTDCILVVHSYGGMLGTAVADRRPDRIGHLVYVDAVLPAPGESWGSAQPPETRAQRLAGAEADPLYAFPAPPPDAFGLTGALADWVARRQTPHPGHTYTQPLQFDPLRVAAVPRTFISCTRPALPTIDSSRRRLADPGFWGGAWQAGGGVRVVEMATGHDPMLSAPAAFHELLLALAA
jgi:pimeloyl-ACP methyl ester carboxylesterase